MYTGNRHKQVHWGVAENGAWLSARDSHHSPTSPILQIIQSLIRLSKQIKCIRFLFSPNPSFYPMLHIQGREISIKVHLSSS